MFRKPFCRCSRFMIFGATFLKFTYYFIFSESACVLRIFSNTVYAVCPYVFNRTLSYSILYSVVVFVFLPSILQTLFFLLPFQRAIEWRAAMLLRASQFHNPVCLWCSFSFSTFFPDNIILLFSDYSVVFKAMKLQVRSSARQAMQVSATAGICEPRSRNGYSPVTVPFLFRFFGFLPEFWIMFPAR